MASTTRTLIQKSTRATLPSILTLARWRWRQSWYLLAITGLGIVMAVMIICTIPLFSDITATAGLRSALKATPTANELQLSVSTPGLSSQALHDMQQQISPLFQQPLQSYLSPQAQFTIQIPGLNLISPRPSKQGNEVQIFGSSIAQATPHIALVQGRLPQENSSELETILTPATAANMHAHLGQIITVQFTFSKTASVTGTITRNLNMRLVGLFNPTSASDSFWHGTTFQPTAAGDWTNYTALISNTTFIQAMDQIAQQLSIKDVIFNQPYALLWYYHLDPARITINSLDDLGNQLNIMQTGINNKYGSLEHSDQLVTQYPYLQKVDVTGAALDTSDGPGILSQYRAHISLTRIPVAILALQIMALVLIFVSMMAELLVDRQADAIAVLRSRGASGRQIFGSLATQSLILSLIGLLLGPVLAVEGVALVSQRILPAESQDAIQALLSNPTRIVQDVWWYALLAALITVIAMVISLIRPTRMDVLNIRREAARATRKPLWLRLNLDIIAALIAITGYVVSLYITNIGGLLDERTRSTISAPLILIAPIFLLIAGVLLFMRLFPLVLHLAAIMAVRGRGAAPMLALAQMARAPRQALRMTLLLSLASAFAIFTLVFTATQAQRTLDMSTYQAGADFSGAITTAYQMPVIDQVNRTEADYQKLPGVTAASIGYQSSGVSAGTSPTVHLQVEAVDTQTFGNVGSWPTSNSTPLPAVMQLLKAKHEYAIENNKVPVVVDDATWKTLDLQVGTTFGVTSAVPGNDITCIVVGKVEHIPTINDITDASAQDNVQGGLLVDYQTLQEVVQSSSPDATLNINHVWLQTSNNAAVLNQLRTQLNTSTLRLTNLLDRRAIQTGMQSDPLSLNLVGVLSLGATTALMLALIGSLLASWSSARARLTNFAVLRALGTTPPQVASVLTWEQTIIYITAVVLGMLFGALLSYTVVPTLVFTSVPVNSSSVDPTSSAFFALQHVLPTQIVIPLSLGIAFVVLVVICIIALSMMVRVVSRPSMSQLLRLNED